MKTMQNHYQTIANYLDNKSTASSEAFNDKIKAFRSQFRGVRKVLISSSLGYQIFMHEIFNPPEPIDPNIPAREIKWLSVPIVFPYLVVE